MLLTILLLNLFLRLTDASADAKSSPEQSLEGLVEKLEFRLREMELRLEDTDMRMKKENEKQAQEKKELEAKNKEMERRLEAKDKEMERRLAELEKKMKEEKYELEREMEASTSKLRKEVEDSEESLRTEFASNFTKDNALTKPSLRDLPIVIISAWRLSGLTSPQTVTFESFLANFNNADRPGGGDGVFDLDSGIFTCFAPGYYTVSFSAHSDVGGGQATSQDLYLFKNGSQLDETYWNLYVGSSLSDMIGATGSRIVVSCLSELFASKFPNLSTFLQIFLD